jgi:hypothetical protein
MNGRPFEPGNKMGRGRPKGSRNKRSDQALQILDQYAPSLVKKCVAKALEGDTRALALCMERILPPLREPGIHLKLPKLDDTKSVDLALERLMQSIGGGNITPIEGEKLATILQNYRATIESQEMVARIEALEAKSREQERRRQDERHTKKKSADATKPARERAPGDGMAACGASDTTDRQGQARGSE